MKTKRSRVSLGDPLFMAKTCVHCQEEYTPTSGRQQVCQKAECRAWKKRNYPSRKNGRYVKSGERPVRKKCDWLDCPEVFDVGATGLVPPHCEIHTREVSNAYSIESRKNWSRRTLDIPCRYPDCEFLQHPKASGWCHKHYPIWSVHGVNADKWWAMFDEQDGICPICEAPLFDGRVVVVDHDHTNTVGPRHTVEHVRGLLHSAPCNGMILGGIETAIANGWFENAMRYIKVPWQESNLP